MLRNAHVDDVEEMNCLINQFAKKDLMLPRPLSELYERIRDYHVYVENGSVKGCVALHVFWKDLAEIKSVAVDENLQKKGDWKRVGTKMP
jgi:amino-acid N-acetyltransferase